MKYLKKIWIKTTEIATSVYYSSFLDFVLFFDYISINYKVIVHDEEIMLKIAAFLVKALTAYSSL